MTAIAEAIVTDEKITDAEFHAPVRAPALAPLSVQGALSDLDQLRAFINGAMREGTDFGVIPGTGSKPTLLQPGAQKIVMYFNTYPRPSVVSTELGDGHVEHIVTASLISRSSEQEVQAGIGSCTTMESKYRFRNAALACPECGSVGAVIKGKAEYGGGWVCYGKKGGCGEKFRDGDPQIELQPRGQVENPNIWDQRNTVLKMAHKRALVAAAHGLSCVSEFFTQDLEDFAETHAAAIQEAAPAGARGNRATANQLATIAKLSRLLGQPDEPGDMTSAEASERITELSREYNERKGAPAGKSKSRTAARPDPAPPPVSDPEEARAHLGDLCQRLAGLTGQTPVQAVASMCQALGFEGRKLSALSDEQVIEAVPHMVSKLAMQANGHDYASDEPAEDADQTDLGF